MTSGPQRQILGPFRQPPSSAAFLPRLWCERRDFSIRRVYDERSTPARHDRGSPVPPEFVIVAPQIHFGCSVPAIGIDQLQRPAFVLRAYSTTTTMRPSTDGRSIPLPAKVDSPPEVFLNHS